MQRKRNTYIRPEQILVADVKWHNQSCWSRYFKANKNDNTIGVASGA